MDAETLVLTANTETVYGMGFLDLKGDGPTVVEAPPKMLGAAMDTLQRWLVDIGPLGPDKGKGGKYLFLPPGYKGEVPEGYFVVKSPTYSVSYFVRGFKVDGKTDQAVALMKQIKVYPLAKAADPPKMEFLNGSGKPIDTIHSDTITFFEMLAQLVNEEPAEVFTPLERFYMQAIGIEKGKPFNPDAKAKALLSEAARAAAAMARANSFASRDADTYYYKDRKWQYVGDVPYNFVKDGVLQVDRRAYVYYMALGNSPAMMAKNVGVGSYYLWTYKDAAGNFLDGAKNYKLHIPRQRARQGFLVGAGVRLAEPMRVEERPEVPLGQQVHRSEDQRRRLGGRLLRPRDAAGQEKNWIKTVPGKGWFPIFRFYGPPEPLYDKTWKLPDIEKVGKPTRRVSQSRSKRRRKWQHKSQPATATQPVPVTVENFARAESRTWYFGTIASSRKAVWAEFHHHREPVANRPSECHPLESRHAVFFVGVFDLQMPVR